MSEPIIERLSRFTPDAGALDRDALLFAAGRASAHPNRVWITLSGALAAAWVLTLVVLWPHPAPPSASLPLPPPAAPSEPPVPEFSETPGLWSAHHRLLDSEPEERPSPADTGRFVDTGPPLRAVAPPPPSILN
jgi:hypothetical protein